MILFTWTYLPQALLLLPFHGRAAFFNAFILVLGEGSTLTALLFEAFFVDLALVDVFDAVLLHEGCATLLERGREVYSSATNAATSTPGRPGDAEQVPIELNSLQRLGESYFSPVYSPFSFPQICEFILLLPLNLVPYVGVPCFLLLTGARGGPLHHHRYFRLRGLKKSERRAEVKARSLRYTWFGTSALMLQLIPGLSMAFLLTTATGSALWVVDIDQDRRKTGAAQTSYVVAESGEEREAIDRRADAGYYTFERAPLLEGNAAA